MYGKGEFRRLVTITIVFGAHSEDLLPGAQVVFASRSVSVELRAVDCL